MIAAATLSGSQPSTAVVEQLNQVCINQRKGGEGRDVLWIVIERCCSLSPGLLDFSGVARREYIGLPQGMLYDKSHGSISLYLSGSVRVVKEMGNGLPTSWYLAGGDLPKLVLAALQGRNELVKEGLGKNENPPWMVLDIPSVEEIERDIKRWPCWVEKRPKKAYHMVGVHYPSKH